MESRAKWRGSFCPGISQIHHSSLGYNPKWRSVHSDRPNGPSAEGWSTHSKIARIKNLGHT